MIRITTREAKLLKKEHPFLRYTLSSFLLVLLYIEIYVISLTCKLYPSKVKWDPLIQCDSFEFHN